MALNVRFLQKAGVEPAAAVTGVGLNSLVGRDRPRRAAGRLLRLGRSGRPGSFTIPSSSKLLVAIAVVLALVGIVSATRRGRRLVRTQVWGFIKQSASSIAALAHRPSGSPQLFGGSIGVTLAYIGALAAAVAAFHGDVSVAEVGAVYLGASIIAAAAPTPGGLGALEAAVVAGLTGVGMESGAAVAAVLSYRLVTYWLPILPGWISFHVLERKGQI